MPKIQFYPLDITYSVKNNKTQILLFGTTIDNKSICIIDEVEPYFYLILKEGFDIDSFAERIKPLTKKEDDNIYAVTDTSIVKKKLMGKEVNAIKVNFNVPKARSAFKNILKNREEILSINEASIPTTRKYLIDKNIVPTTLYEVDGEETTFKVKSDLIIKPNTIEQISNDSLQPKILAFDIETYNPLGKELRAEEFPILMISFYGNNFKKVITWKRFTTDENYIEFVNSEADLIVRFKNIIEEYQPDILSGFASDKFDLPYIKTRAEKYKIELDLGLDYSNLRKSREAMKITGITHLDIKDFIKFMMGDSLETDTFDLDSVSEELLGENKKKIDISLLSNVWDNEPEKIGRYCEYNLQDSFLTYKLCEKILPNILELVKLVSQSMFEITRMGFSQLTEWYLLKEAGNELSPNNPTHDQVKERLGKSYKGGFVFEPKAGLYKDIIVFDFRSLYPTIIASHNISPDVLNYSCQEEERDYAPVENEKIWFPKNKTGLIPKIVKELITRRMRINEMLKTKSDPLLKARSYGLKILANSFYGYLGFYAAKWYSIECARAVTAWGRYYITKVIKKAEEENFDVLYSDTDSVFLSLKDRPKQDAIKFMEKINLELPELMELELEGFYPRGIFVSAKVGTQGAKKKYALLTEKGHLHITGFETVRRNWSQVAKDLQENILRIILLEKDIKKAKELFIETVNMLRKKDIDKEHITIYTKLSKEIDEYEQIGPHVAVAKRMRDKGVKVGAGSTVRYIITEGKEKIRDRARIPEEIKENELDDEYYIFNQIVPAVQKIFEVLGINTEDLLSEKEQSKLQSFI